MLTNWIPDQSNSSEPLLQLRKELAFNWTQVQPMAASGTASSKLPSSVLDNFAVLFWVSLRNGQGCPPGSYKIKGKLAWSGLRFRWIFLRFTFKSFYSIPDSVNACILGTWHPFHFACSFIALNPKREKWTELFMGTTAYTSPDGYNSLSIAFDEEA